MSEIAPEAVLDYWFGPGDDWAAIAEANKSRWFLDGRALDDEIRSRFADAVLAARRGDLDHWADAPRSAMALVLLLDQFPRHIYRGTAEAFASDEQALAVCRAGIERGLDTALSAVERTFFYLPLQHAEDLLAQLKSVEMLARCAATCAENLCDYVLNSLEYAQEHLEIVKRFGRFPHRNDVLGRASSEEEQDYLASGANRFGQ